jgi:hypothetical protein
MARDGKRRIKAKLEIRRHIEAKLAAYRKWAAGRKRKKTARLVHYVTDGCTASDVPSTEIESQIEGCLAEGFHVDWSARGERLYLRVYEGGPEWEPDWEDVFAERSIPLFTMPENAVEHGDDNR